MAEKQCSVCGAFPHLDGSPTCRCEMRAAEDLATVHEDTFRPLRVRPYFVPEGLDGPEPAAREADLADRAFTPPPFAVPPPPGFPGAEVDAEPRAEDVDLFESSETVRRPHGSDGCVRSGGHGEGGDHGAPGGPGESGEGGAAGERGEYEHGEENTAPLPRVPAQRTGNADDDPGGLVVLAREYSPGELRRRQRRNRVPAVTAAVAVLGMGAAFIAAGVTGSDGQSDDITLPAPTLAAPTASALVPTFDGRDPDTPSAKPSRSSTGKESTPAAPRSDSGGRPSATIEGAITTAPRAPAPEPEPSDTPAGPPTLRPGDSGAEVTELQDRLKQVYLFYLGASDGEYDTEVATWVGQFQRDRGISQDPDGVYGPRTRRALEAETEEP